PKFYKFRAVIQKHLSPGQITIQDTPPYRKIAINEIKLDKSAALFSNLGKPVVADRPLCFEDLNQGYGFVLYRTTLKNTVNGLLKIKEMRDYATVYINGKRIGILDRRLRQDSL